MVEQKFESQLCDFENLQKVLQMQMTVNSSAFQTRKVRQRFLVLFAPPIAEPSSFTLNLLSPTCKLFKLLG